MFIIKERNSLLNWNLSMKKIKNLFLTSLVILFCVAQAYAQEIQNTVATSITNDNALAINDKEPVLVAPVISDPKITDEKETKKPPKSRKLSLKAVIFDPNADFEAQAKEENREMTKAEQAEYNLHEALHGEVSTLSTKGLLADKMKMTFEKGPIEYIAPWMDYNGYFSEVWNGPTFTNTTYGINFADVGVNIKMRDQKTNVRFMISPVKSVEGRTYMQTLFADNYITRKVGKNNTILIGHTWLPMGFEGKESPLVWQFFNRSQTSLRYSASRTLGGKIMGNYKYLDYHLGFYSSGRAFRDFTPGPEVAGWFEFKPLANLDPKKYGKLTIGTGFNGGNAESHYAVGMAGVNYEYKRIRFVTEAGISDGSNGAIGYSAAKSRGLSSTLAYRVTPRLQVLGRYDVMDPNTDINNNLRREYTAGINYFIKDYAARLMANYVLYSLENGTYGSRILVGTQIVL